MFNWLLMFEETTTTPKNDWLNYVLIGVIIVFMVLMFILPNRKSKKQEKEKQESLKVGAWVTTIGGIVGEVTEVTDAGFVLITGSGENKTTMRFIRQALYQVAAKPPVDESGNPTEEKPVYNEIK